MTYGNRVDIDDSGLLRIDGTNFRGGVPTLGKDIFVDSVTGADSGSDGLTPDRALATLDAAFAKCTADKGYQIFVLPNHSETVTGAAGIAHDVAGVSVMGLGFGGNRPTFLMDGGTAVTYAITGADAFVHNLVFNSGNSDVVTCFNITAATNVRIHGCEFGDNTTSENWLTCIKSGTADNASDGLSVTDNIWTSIDAGSLEFIEITGDLDRLLVSGNLVTHEGTAVSPLIVVTDGDDVQDAKILNNTIRNKVAAANVGILVTNQTDNTGVIAGNTCGTLDTAGELISTANSGIYHFENYSSSVVTASGYILPARDTA